jgi:hypothetical protein
MVRAKDLEDWVRKLPAAREALRVEPKK